MSWPLEESLFFVISSTVFSFNAAVVSRLFCRSGASFNLFWTLLCSFLVSPYHFIVIFSCHFPSLLVFFLYYFWCYRFSHFCAYCMPSRVWWSTAFSHILVWAWIMPKIWIFDSLWLCSKVSLHWPFVILITSLASFLLVPGSRNGSVAKGWVCSSHVELSLRLMSFWAVSMKKMGKSVGWKISFNLTPGVIFRKYLFL